MNGALPALLLAGFAQFAGASSYLVEGVVVDAKSGAAIPHVRVTLALAKHREQKTDLMTGEDGRFSFAVSQPDKYSLQISRPGYPPQFYKEAGFSAVSSAIVVRDDQDTRHIVFAAWRGGAITGLVKDEDGEPVANALVDIYRSMILGGERKILRQGEMRADARGEFRFRNLQRGNYYVCAMGRPWFADSVIQLEGFEQRRWVRHRTVRAQTSGQTEAAEPPPDSEPEPAPISFSPDPNLRGTAFQTTCYPSARTVDQAATVRVEPGGETEVAIALPFAKAVSVKGSISGATDVSSGVVSLSKKIQDHHMLFLREWPNQDGAFEFHNVPAGSYEIVASSQANEGAASWSMRQEVEVGAADVEVQLRPSPIGSFSGRMIVDGEAPDASDARFVTLHDEKGTAISGEVDADHQFSLKRLPAGRYEVTSISRDYLPVYLEGPSGAQLPLTFDLAPGAAVRLNVVASRASSSIEGTVEHAGAPYVGAFVLLMPKNPAQRWAYRQDQTDSDGSYSLGTIAAGDYLAIALTSGEEVAYRDARTAAILAKAARLVHVGPAEHQELKLELLDTTNLKLPAL